MLKIRLQRVGRINSPSYRIVVTEAAWAAKKGLIEKLGTYNPKTKERTLNEERVKYWLSVGAQPTDTMHNMFVSLGIVSGKKINVLPAYKAPEAPVTEGNAGGAQAAAEASAEAPAETSVTEGDASAAEAAAEGQ